MWNPFNTKETYNFKGSYSASDIAMYVLYKCIADKQPISNLQLQKILYYIQRYFLQDEKRALFKDEIEAWPFGPVVRDVYYQYCGYGALQIKDIEKPSIVLTNLEKQVIDNIISEKRSVTPWDLVEDTHREGRAWDIIYKSGVGYKDVIPKEVIVTNG
ncbi:Panacea domain-containing protein [uncultured Veillonella sp.]|uniref:Panacea domain-containing protein n=1 Tax=uncultured Veillonella sp. TaxID=159268 RepID=UPI0025952873|nr:type II toxin-antitoxin system antitoxin SocA domain-containing protein [uncultured Veillonella sp.]